MSSSPPGINEIAKGAGYSGCSQPPWFLQGWEEQLALNYSTEKNRVEVRAKYLDMVRQNPKSIGLGFMMENPYSGGALFQDFFAERYGKDAPLRVTRSQKPDFGSAFEEVTGNGWFTVSNEFGVWLEAKTGLPARSFSIDPKIVSANTALQKARAEQQAMAARVSAMEKRLARSQAELATARERAVEGGKEIDALKSMAASLQARNQELEATEPVTIEMRVDDRNYTLNGRPNTLSVPPTIVEGTTLVPIRLISEAFGAKVTWDGETRTIVIIRP